MKILVDPRKVIASYFKKCKSDHRHIVCFFVTLISIGMGFLFPNSIPRLAETFRDLGLSIAYYFCELIFPDNNPIQVTVVGPQSWMFAESIWKPIKLFPYTWEEFKVLWNQYWQLFISKENLIDYWIALGDLLYNLSKLMLVVVPLILILTMWIGSYKSKYCTDRNRKSGPLKRFERFLFKRIYPIISWFKSFVLFCTVHRDYIRIWAFLWLMHFNIISIIVAFLSYYLYFTPSWDIVSLYPQVLKLLTDLTPMIRFVPGIAWFMLGVYIYNRVCRSMAFTRLYHQERCNRAFLGDRGIVTTVYGEMGIGKTQMVTSMALSAEIEQFDAAFEIMIETDAKYPNFPWQIFRDELKKKIDSRVIVDLPTCRCWVRKARIYFDYISENYTPEEWKERRKHCKYIKNDYTFGYDYVHYRTTYNDELKISHLYEALEDYACAYLAFTVKTTLLFANYSIRVDSILQDLGNMPIRDSDFFNRPPEYQEAYSRHAHIIDIDMLRLGKKMIQDNPKARRVSFGVYVITEIDKEFKNMQELKEMKINEKACNQKNDLHNACMMMIRHACVIANRVFVRIIADLQRPEAWGAGGRELGEIIYIYDKSELSPALPFFSPYWFFQGIFSWIKSKWDGFYNAYIVNRSDSTLFVYLCHNITALINNHYDKVMGKFGSQTLKLELQSGRMDGEVKKGKWYLMTKKDRSRRYRTACLEAVFESYKPNTMHIDDYIQYAGEVGTDEENQLQNSYFQNDIKKMKDLNADKGE